MTPFARRLRLLVSAFSLALITSACVTHLPDLAANASAGPTLPPAWPTPPVAAGDAPPGIVAAHFSSLDVKRGERWSGIFVTPTNTASLEVRTNLFSINVPRTAYGRFAFETDVFDTPPIFVRPYRLRLIARNAAGDEAEEDLPFQIR
jgi:hypothetical protein